MRELYLLMQCSISSSWQANFLNMGIIETMNKKTNLLDQQQTAAGLTRRRIIQVQQYTSNAPADHIQNAEQKPGKTCKTSTDVNDEEYQM